MPSRSKASARLIEDYTLEVFTPPCDPGTQRFASIARLQVDISPVLPLLNAILPGAIYLPHANALTWKKDKLHVTLNAQEIAISSFENRQAAAEAVQDVVDLVNRTYSRREQITPEFEPRRRLVPMEIYKLLPGSNCKACGEPTCYTFALKLVSRQADLDACAVLHEPNWATQYSKIEALIAHAPTVDRQA
jgi:ArsR family metal-binding transcriptional regulator